MTYPTIMPAITLDFANSKRLDNRINFSRSTAGTYRDSDGLIKTAPANVARFDHDENGRCLGLLIEPSRTNSIQYSEDFSAATGYWSNPSPSVTFTTGQESPDGNNTGTLFTGEGNVQRASVTTNTNTSHNNPDPAIFTVFAKLTDTVETNIRLELSASSGSSYRIIFNLSTGTVVSNDGSDANVTAAKITPYLNGWYRCQVKGSIPKNDSASVFIKNYADSIFWGAQLELTNRQNWASAYIQNAGTVGGVNRGADVVYVYDFGDSFNGISGALVTKYLPPGGNQYGSPSGLGRAGSGRPTISHVSGTSLDGVLSAKIGGNAGSKTNPNGIDVPDIACLSFTPGDSAYAINYSSLGTTTNDNWINHVDNIESYLKLSQTGGNFSAINSMRLMRISVYPERVSNPSVQILSRA